MAKRRGQKLGELLEAGGMWGVRYYVDTPEFDPVTGKRKRGREVQWLAPSKGPGAIGKREVNRLRMDHMARVDQFAIRPSSACTLEDFVRRRFEPDVMETLKPNGKAFYKNMLYNHILPQLGKFLLRDLSVGNVQDLINLELKRGKSTQTAAHAKNCLSAVLRHAKAMQWFAGELPTASVRIPQMKRKERRAMTWEQVCRLAGVLPEPVSTLVILLALTGLRIGEAMGLRWKYVNLTSEMRIVSGEVIPPMSIAVRESYVRGQYQTLKTTGSRRNIPIPVWLLPRIAALTSSHAKKEAVSLESPVFANLTATVPLDQHNMAARILKDAAASVGLGTPAIPATETTKGRRAQSWVSWHVLRHTNATLSEQAGFGLSERQRILGHAAESMTMHYSHSDLERLRPRMELMVDPTKLIQ